MQTLPIKGHLQAGCSSCRLLQTGGTFSSSLWLQLDNDRLPSFTRTEPFGGAILCGGVTRLHPSSFVLVFCTCEAKKLLARLHSPYGPQNDL